MTLRSSSSARRPTALAVFLALAFSSALAFAAPTPELSMSGLGQAQFGMTLKAAEQALGVPISFLPEVVKTGIGKADCATGTVHNLLGVFVFFERGRFIAVEAREPTIATTLGFRVGDREKAVIAKFRTYPTYQRHPNRYDDAVTEITVGKAAFLEGRGGWQGRVGKFTSKGGVIRTIAAGEARYVMLDEHEGCM